MKRNTFVRTLISATALLAIPFDGIAKTISKIREKKGYKTDSGADRVQKPMHLFEGDTFYTKISTTDTDGDLYVYESTRIKKGGPNLHVHYEQDEWWYIVEGEFQIKVGDQLFHAKPPFDLLWCNECPFRQDKPSIALLARVNHSAWA